MKLEKRIKIKNKWVGGENDPCFVIAEAGSNHNRDFETAKKLIDAAKQVGADAVKFQTFSAQGLYLESKEPLRLIGEKEKPFNIMKKIEMPRRWHKPLAEYARKSSLIFLSTPFDEEAINQLDNFVPAFKWGSPELTDMPLLEKVAKKKKPLILSTGFYGINEVTEAVKWVVDAGNNKIIILHCTGLYPANDEEINLRAITTLRRQFNCPIGFSDHSTSVVIPAAAVALGAKVIEKHFTLNKKSKGPDHFFALEPNELGEMVDNIRKVERSLGSYAKKPVKREITKEKLIRRGITSTAEIKKGERISAEKIITRRTGAGAILPRDYNSILRKKAKKSIKANRVITWKLI